ncbi:MULTISPECIES: flagellar filament capping protein FliD [unclassified Methylophaga]|jgi:flagellar hook-associated protein 2|uniref:flagellar filament capping protein FliD n=1 Tax=unclassified Methylophaga TaxID=2629249 RepID=UPI000C0F28F6|nr:MULTISPECIES: flagellar filament capping protein FliD [unclassified Methylophaga]MBL1456613.1 flagellar filament capping protein FliD [Methylophaga sp.]|tara:strand:+ start:2938 stop:4299 length:1362 start_codon:yes stop_codon:yes gene_type:complete
MATIQAPGIGSGLDVNDIVTKLMEIERQPIDNLTTKKSFVNAQISAYGSLKSKVSDFQTAMSNLNSPEKFQVYQATSGSESVFTSSVSSGAVAGNYNIEVVNLAERDKIATKAYTDSSTVVGEGTLNISIGADSFELTIDGTNNTLAGIRDAINNATDNTGVSATIVTGDDGARLVLSSEETGTDNALRISVTDSDGGNTDETGLSALAYNPEGGVEFRAAISSAQNALVRIDGFNVSSSTNTITGAVDGITINAASIGTTTLSVTRDDEKILESVEAFATAFNALRTEINNQRSGQLEADSTLLSLERQVFDVLNAGSSIDGSSFSYLIEAGVSIDKNGVMGVDSDRINDIMNTDFESFTNLFASENGGFAAKLSNLANGWLETNGLIDSREDGLKTQVEGIDDQILRMEDRLISVEARIRAQFTALDTLVSSLNNTSSFLTQQLASLNKNN